MGVARDLHRRCIYSYMLISLSLILVFYVFIVCIMFHDYELFRIVILLKNVVYLPTWKAFMK